MGGILFRGSWEETLIGDTRTGEASEDSAARKKANEMGGEDSASLPHAFFSPYLFPSLPCLRNQHWFSRTFFVAWLREEWEACFVRQMVPEEVTTWANGWELIRWGDRETRKKDGD